MPSIGNILAKIRFINYIWGFYNVIYPKNCFFLVILIVSFTLSFFILSGENILSAYGFQEKENRGILTITLSSINGSLLSNGTFLIAPDPIMKNQPFLIADNDLKDVDKSQGTISLTKLPNGNYTVTQGGTASGFLPSTVSKIVTIDNKTSPVSTTSFVNIVQETDRTDQYENYGSGYTYNAKFVCGSIRGDEGPLRPGHYDTDISIYNKQKYTINLSLNVVFNNGGSTNSLLKKLEPESSLAFVCKDIKELSSSNAYDTDFLEGFVIIAVDGISDTFDSLGKVISSSDFQKDYKTEPVSIQVFYTANALDSLPHEILIDKIVFQVLEDPSGKIPESLLKTDLAISTRSELNKISDESLKIKSLVASEYNLTESELAELSISIQDTDIGVASMIDDHAISLFRLVP